MDRPTLNRRHPPALADPSPEGDLREIQLDSAFDPSIFVAQQTESQPLKASQKISKTSNVVFT